MSSQKRDRPGSMLAGSRQNSLSNNSTQFNVKPITIRTNSLSLPGFAQPRAKSRASKVLQFANQIFLKLKRLYRLQTRRRLERNWYQIGALTLVLFFLFYFTKVFAGFGSFQFTHTSQLGPRMAETIEAMESLQYMSSNDVMVTLDKDKIYSGVRRAKLYPGTRIRRQIMDNQPDPVIRVVDADILDEALRLKRQGFKPIVLDMANRVYPGGDKMELRKKLVFFVGRISISAWIQNHADLNSTRYQVKEPSTVMAPLRNPPLVANEANEMILGERAVIITKKKIQNMFRIALDNGHDAIVLSAFGCGRLHNPPESVARIFKQVIRSNYMGGVKKGRTFAEIVFAITPYQNLEDPTIRDTYNFDTFKRVMESSDELSEDELDL
ncbi:hypothetical protein BGZ94_009927 [Podila epigama]|nr:hypothetical protein BGZ94_009927 [Podila epigama]